MTRALRAMNWWGRIRIKIKIRIKIRIKTRGSGVVHGKEGFPEFGHALRP